MSSFTKPKIYNLALSALLLGKEVSDVLTDTSNEVRILNTHWDTAFESTLQDLDLDALSEPVSLELLANLSEDSEYTGAWTYAYKYPTKCVFLRRIDSGQVTDNKRTHISKRIALYNGVKAIFTNEVDAVAECITDEVPLTSLTPMAALAIAYKLAYLSAPLLVGKGAKNLRKEIDQQYIMAKAEAQETDRLENFNYESDDLRSEFVAARYE